MGRVLKRVPLNFDWPIGQVWAGYISPHKNSRECPRCGGSGYHVEAGHLYDQWYGKVHFDPVMTGSAPFTPFDAPIRVFAERNFLNAPEFYMGLHGALTEDMAIMREAERLCQLFNSQWSHHLDDDDVKALVDKRRLVDLTHHWTPEGGWVPNDPFVIPSAREVNEWSISGFGHDSINAWTCVAAKAKRLGLARTCGLCRGWGSLWVDRRGRSRRKVGYQKRRTAVAYNWEKVEPPRGKGYQLWDTVSAGKPLSPVFASAVEFEDYLVGEGYSRKAARIFIRVGWCPTHTASESGIKSNVQTCEDMSRD